MDIEEKMAIQRGANPNVNQWKDAQLLAVRSQIKIKWDISSQLVFGQKLKGTTTSVASRNMRKRIWLYILRLIK